MTTLFTRSTARVHSLPFSTARAAAWALPLVLLLASAMAQANTLPAARYAEMMTLEMMDTDKDGVVSREEFLAAAAKMYDMAAAHMKAKDGRLTSVQLREFRSALSNVK